MIDKIKAYFETLETLSTEELDRSAEKLVRAEKRNVVLVIAHIAEMSRRKGHLEPAHRARQERPEEKACSATRTEGEERRQFQTRISPGQDCFTFLPTCYCL